MTIYDVLKDQGSTIAAFIALVGGLAAYAAARKQATLMQGQIDVNRLADKKRIYRDGLAALNIVFAIVKTHQYHALQVASRYCEDDDLEVAQIAQSMNALPLIEIKDSVAMLDYHQAEQYYDLIRRIGEFRAVSGKGQMSGLVEMKKTIVQNMSILMTDLDGTKKRLAELLSAVLDEEARLH